MILIGEERVVSTISLYLEYAHQIVTSRYVKRCKYRPIQKKKKSNKSSLSFLVSRHTDFPLPLFCLWPVAFFKTEKRGNYWDLLQGHLPANTAINNGSLGQRERVQPGCLHAAGSWPSWAPSSKCAWRWNWLYFHLWGEKEYHKDLKWKDGNRGLACSAEPLSY